MGFWFLLEDFKGSDPSLGGRLLKDFNIYVRRLSALWVLQARKFMLVTSEARMCRRIKWVCEIIGTFGIQYFMCINKCEI